MLKQIKRRLRNREIRQITDKFPNFPLGSREWLVGAEIKYGGFISNVPRNKVSQLDHRTKEEMLAGGMTGGDRMIHHGYGPSYARYLEPFVKSKKKVVVAEIGILVGTGLAIWCDLFPDGRILGLDIDLLNIHNNMQKLNQRGAFKKNSPELAEFDQLINNQSLLNGILHGEKIDICIDDGLHSDDSILTTLNSVKQHLADNFVYFVEDNDTVHQKIRVKFPEFSVESLGELTVIRP